MHVFIGFDPREAAAFAVARASVFKHLHHRVPVTGLVLDELRGRGLYRRPTSRVRMRLWDDISGAAMATEFANSRFLVPYLMGYEGWALFMDCDVLVRRPLADLFAHCDAGKAVMCVQHDYVSAATEKMDGQENVAYPRKNWSSVMLMNCGHPACAALTLDYVNEAPGLDLHQFKWCEDRHIGVLPKGWNHLVGEYPENPDARIAHFTLGGPWFEGCKDVEFAGEWTAALQKWALA